MKATMKLSDSGIMHGRNHMNSGCESTSFASGSSALPSSADLRRLLEVADEQDMLARETLQALMAELEHRAMVIARHSYRTAAWSVWLAAMAQTPAVDLAALVVAAVLHDIGKLGIEDEILMKPAELTQAETQVMSQHNSLGA